MPASISKSQIDKLGERLGRSEIPSEADLLAYQALRSEYDAPLSEVVAKLRELGLNATPRLKTVNTVIEKLRRERTRLSTIQDIAGVRVVVDATLTEQNALVGRVQEALEPLGDVRIVDRRTEPSHGYRAVHLVILISGFLVEVQIRTALQDLWAQVVEKTGDLFGRGIRYGEIPAGTPPGVPGMLQDASLLIAGIERRRSLPSPDPVLAPPPEAPAELKEAVGQLTLAQEELAKVGEEYTLAMQKLVVVFLQGLIKAAE